MPRSVYTYLGSYGLAILGNGISSVVLPLLVLARTGDVLAAGLLATVTTATTAAVGLVGGLIVDRVDRRLASATADMLSALSMAALPVVDAIWGLNMTWFIVIGIIGAAIDGPGMTAHEILLPALVRLEDGKVTMLDRLLASRETVSHVLLLAGPGIGGGLVWLLGLTPTLLYLTAAASLLAGLLTLSIDPRAGRIGRRDPVGGPAHRGIRRTLHDLVEPWRFLLRTRIVLGATLISAMFVALISALQTTLMPAYFTAQNLPSFAGLVLSAFAAGSIVGSVIYAATIGRVRRRVWFIIGMVGTIVGFAALGSLASPWIVAAAATLIGLTNTPAGTVLGVLVIQSTPDRIRGGVLGAQNSLLLGAPAVFTTPLAAVASGAGMPTAGVVVAAIAVATGLIALLVPTFRRLDEVASAGERSNRVPVDGSQIPSVKPSAEN